LAPLHSRRVYLVAAAFVVVALSARAARAQEDRMRTVVRAATSADRELLSRVQGQTVDVDVELLPVRDPLEASVSAQLRAAAALSRKHSARVVVWFRHLPDGEVVVYVADPGEGTVLIRQVATPVAGGSSVERSAAAEAAALVVRSALKALAAGGRIGVERPEVAAPPEPEEPPEAPTTATKRRSRTAWLTSVGWHSALDGASSFGVTGLTARLGHQRGRVVFALVAAASLPVSIEDDLTSVEIARHVAAASLGVDAWAGERAALTAELSVGVVGFFRSTVALQPEAEPTPSRVTPALLVAPGLRLRVRPLSSVRSVWLELGVAADIVIGRPELGYERDGEFVRRDQLWPVQPRAELALGIRAF